MNKAVSLHPAKNETTRLEGFVRSGKTPVRLLERSRIVLLAAEGKSNREIAQSMGVTEHKVGRWRNRYAEDGFAGIEKDRPRGANCGGKKTRDRVALRSKVIEWTTRRKPENATRRSTRTLAEEPGTSHSFVSRVWRSCGLEPHSIRTFGIGNDPRFEEKLADVAGLYPNPPDSAVVFSIDEKSSIRALDRTRPTLPIIEGRCGTVTHGYRRQAQWNKCSIRRFGGAVLLANA